MIKLFKFCIKIIILIVIFYVLFKIVNIQDIILKNIYPKEYEQQVTTYSEMYNVDENLIYAIIKAETNFDPNAVSNKDARGLMQLMYDTAADDAKIVEIEINEQNLLEPEININLGTKYISMLIEKYENIEVALAAYNAGSGNVDKWIAENTIKADGSNIENIPFKETNNYVRKILRDYKIYKQIY